MSTPVRRSLLLLTVAVLAAHGWLLQGGPEALQAPRPRAAPAFVTRSVEVAAPAPAPTVVQPARAAAGPAVARDAHDAREGRAPAAQAPRPALAAQPSVHLATTRSDAAVAPRPAATPASAPAPARESGAAPAVAITLPGSMRLHYKVEARARGIALQGLGELRWRHDADSYEARLEVSAPLLPTRTQHSAGKITPEGLAPLRFSDKGRHEEAAHFERDKGKVSFSSNRPDAPLLPGAQDRLSVLLQLAAMIAGEPAKYPAGTSVTLQTAGTREAEPWVFHVEGQEVLQLPGGTVPALKLTRSPRREFDIKVELWLAPGMDYVPVRLRLTQPNGDSVDQQWSSTDRG